MHNSSSPKWGKARRCLNSKKTRMCSSKVMSLAPFYFIQKGTVKLTVLSDQGKKAVIGILEPGQFFGEGCMNGHKLRISTTTAIEHSVIHRPNEDRDDLNAS
jgi:CRP/FNR family cyclic AMP-dependent transcriptional regulator